MIEKFHLSQDIEMIVTDEDHDAFDDILTKAKNDTTMPLYKNYLDITIDNFTFVNIFLAKGRPAGFYGLQKKKWIPSYCARAYARTYKLPEFRDDATDLVGYGLTPWKK